MKIPRIVFLLGLTSFFTDFSSEIIMPILPLFILSLGGNATIIGIVGGITEGLSHIIKFFSGYYSDKIQNRRKFVIFGYSLSALAKGLFLFISNWYSVLILKVLERLGKGIRAAPRDALIALSTNRYKGRIFGFHQFMDAFGSVLGSLVAIYIVSLDYKLIFLISFIISLFGIIPLYFIKDFKIETKIKQFSLNFKHWIFLLVVAIFSLGNFTYMLFLMKSGLNSNTQYVLFLYFVFKLTVVSTTYFAGKIYDLIGKYALIMGMLFFIFTLLGFIFNFPYLLVLFIFYGLYVAFTKANFRAFASELAPKEHQGSVIGSFYLVMGIFSLPSGLIAGYLWDNYNPNVPFIFSTVLTIIAIVILLFLNKNKN